MQSVTLDSQGGGFATARFGRRRPLRSRTCDAIFSLLSSFRANHNDQQFREGSDAALQLASKENEFVILNETDLGGALEKSPNGKESAGESNQAASIGENEGVGNLPEVSLHTNETAVPIVDHENLVNVNADTAASEKSGEMVISLVENHAHGCDLEIFKHKETGCSIDDIQMYEFSTFEELPEDNNMFIDDFPEVLRSCMDMDVVFKSSEAVVEVNQSDSMTETIPNEVEHELKLKEMELELEKLIVKSSGLASSSSHQNANGEMEEGEISGDSGDECAPLDSFSEDVLSVRERPGGMLPAPASPNCKGKSANNNLDIRSGNDAILYNQENVGVSENLNNLTCSDQKQLPSLNSLSNTIEDVQDGDARKKKRKRPSLEQRAKKKKKERMKRAEKNRENGVKRLKLLPVLKPKTKEYCRHYLMGRCSEGEKCKFSHDTVPLTKSKPCGHFARNSCMKGEDCPYDHQLSKYPCSNYATNGFCSRGTNCLFSHESSVLASSVTGLTQNMTVDKGGPMVTRADSKFPSPLSNSSCVKKSDVNTVFHQKSAGKLITRVAELTAMKPHLVTPQKVPNGVSFLCNTTLFPGDKHKHKHKLKQNEISVRSTDGLEGAPCNEMSEKVGPRIPRGVNFLSFTKPSSDDLNSTKISNMLSNSNQGKEKSAVDGKMSCFNSNMNSSSIRTPISTKNVSIFALDRSVSDVNGVTTNEFCSSEMTPTLIQRNVQSTLAFAAKLEASLVSQSHLHTG